MFRKASLTRRALIGSGGAALSSLVFEPAVGLTRQAAHSSPITATAAATTRIRLSLNENPYGCSPMVLQALRDDLHDLNRYTEKAADSLTQQIAAREQVAADQVVLGEILPALGLHLGLAGGTGGEFLYSVPGFTDLVDAAAQTGCRAIGVPLNERLENDLPALASRINAGTRALYLVNPHNPSGTVSAPDSFRSFVREISERTLVIVDEAYLEYTEAFAERTCAPLVQSGHNVAVFRTFGKIHGLAALQFGYTLAPASLVAALHQRDIGAPHSLNRLAVTAAAAAMRDRRFIEEVRRATTAERARWNALLDSLGLRHSDSRGSFVFFQTRRAQPQLAAALLARGIDIGRNFPPLEHWARITIGQPSENDRAMEALSRLLRPA